MIQLSEYFQPLRETDRLGFSTENPQFIPESYLEAKQFIVWRTCQSFGDWAIISAMPRLLKAKYPDCVVAVPSPALIKKMYPNGIWSNKHEDYSVNVVEVFTNNPYVDGMMDELPAGLPVYHDHFRIYNPKNLNVPLVTQMLKYWRYEPHETDDSAPELYWSHDEKQVGISMLARLFEGRPFGFLYIDDSFFEVHDPVREPLEYKRKRIQEEIDKYPNLQWLYYAGKDIKDTPYRVNTEAIDLRNVQVTKRVQNYMKSLSWVIIGHQGGYGTDCMSRYPQEGCHVVPNAATCINEHFITTTKYIYPC